MKHPDQTKPTKAQRKTLLTVTIGDPAKEGVSYKYGRNNAYEYKERVDMSYAIR